MATLPNLKTLIVLRMKSTKLCSFALLLWVMATPQDLLERVHWRYDSTVSIGLKVHSFIHIYWESTLFLHSVLGTRDEMVNKNGVSCPIRDQGQREAVVQAIQGRYPEQVKRWPLLVWVVKECAPKKDTLWTGYPPHAWVRGPTGINSCLHDLKYIIEPISTSRTSSVKWDC